MKKILTLIFLVLLLAVPVSAEQKYPAGTLIKSATNPAVYYIGDDGKRHAFPNAKVYHSWYKDFSEVQVVTEFDLADVQLGKNVLYRSGSRLIKTPSVNEVYAVGPWGELRNIASEEVAIALYGADWAKLVDDIDISFFFDYNIVGVIDTDGENIIYPRGSLIHNDGLTWVIDTRSSKEQIARPISGQAWVDNNFDGLLTYKYSGFVTDQYEVGMPVYAEEARFTCPYCSRENFDNKTVFEKNFFNTGLLEYSVSGQLPENWKFTEEQPELSALSLKSQDGGMELMIAIDKKDPLDPQDLSEVLAEFDDSDPILYKGFGLSESTFADIVMHRENGDEIEYYVVYEDKGEYLFTMAFQALTTIEGEITPIEKYWDEIEIILENVNITKITVEEDPVDEGEPDSESDIENV